MDDLLLKIVSESPDEYITATMLEKRMLDYIDERMNAFIRESIFNNS